MRRMVRLMRLMRRVSRLMRLMRRLVRWIGRLLHRLGRLRRLCRLAALGPGGDRRAAILAEAHALVQLRPTLLAEVHDRPPRRMSVRRLSRFGRRAQELCCARPFHLRTLAPDVDLAGLREMQPPAAEEQCDRGIWPLLALLPRSPAQGCGAPTVSGEGMSMLPFR
jgi:hypothetical protein